MRVKGVGSLAIQFWPRVKDPSSVRARTVTLDNGAQKVAYTNAAGTATTSTQTYAWPAQTFVNVRVERTHNVLQLWINGELTELHGPGNDMNVPIQRVAILSTAPQNTRVSSLCVEAEEEDAVAEEPALGGVARRRRHERRLAHTRAAHDLGSNSCF